MKKRTATLTLLICTFLGTADLTANEQQKSPPLTKEHLVALLKGRVNMLEVFFEVRRRRISREFLPSESQLKRLANLGADDVLLTKLSHYCSAVRPQFDKALKDVREGRFEIAIRELNELLKRAPRYAEAIWLRHQAKCGIDRFDEAIDDLDHLLLLQPDSTINRCRTAEVMLELNRTAEAIELLSKLLSEDPTIPRALEVRGQAYERKQEYDSAISDLYDSAIINPLRSKPLLLAAQLHLCPESEDVFSPTAAIELASAASILDEARQGEQRTETKARTLAIKSLAYQANQNFERAEDLKNQALGTISSLSAIKSAEIEEWFSTMRASLRNVTTASRGDVLRNMLEGLQEISAGNVKVGSSLTEDEQPVHEVEISSFLLSSHEITRAQWAAINGGPPPGADEYDLPVDKVSWNDAASFCGTLTEQLNLDGVIFRLPTESEWEYATRAGETGRYGFGDTESDLAEYAWFEDNSDGKVHPVGKKKPNAFGLYDTHGNVAEWCSDYYGAYDSESKKNPTGPSEGVFHVYRGGSRLSSSNGCRSAARAMAPSSDRRKGLGFRIAASGATRDELLKKFNSASAPEQELQAYRKIIALLEQRADLATAGQDDYQLNLYNARLLKAALALENEDYEAARESLEALRKIPLPKRSPHMIAASCHLSWFLATCPDETHRDGDLATKLATAALERAKVGRLVPAFPYLALAAAESRAGNFERATEAAIKARDQKATHFGEVIRGWLQSGEISSPLESALLAVPVVVNPEKLFRKTQ